MNQNIRYITEIAILTAMITVLGAIKIPNIIPGIEFQLSAPLAVAICAVFGFKKYIISGCLSSLIGLALKVSRMGLKGMEFAPGIPGTIGGAIYMNAGAYKSDMASIIENVKLIDENNNIVVLNKEELLEERKMINELSEMNSK